jgi:hypothetical protein
LPGPARQVIGSRSAGEPCTAFVLAGGAALGAMQAGMPHARYERGMVPDLLPRGEHLAAAFSAIREAATAVMTGAASW